MPTEVRNNIALARFEITIDGEVAGYTEYQDTVGERAFVHTEVDPRFDGQGYARTLVEGALDATHREGLGALPMCRVVQHFIETRPQYLSMVPHWARDRLGLPQ
ncbi:GNAT family N-acetyltransferase [Nocardia jinanensis]|uniref:N-acetyltransferase n=1 Tax=Nocardia jinanensis TaxID=382504 RepID=A0A917VX65_9NOCA|nr:GNAT family N-acetyltransferase [Nocardia jinanensis]GGL38807.1 N-acetyltransferase [Nocardia jinanensis]